MLTSSTITYISYFYTLSFNTSKFFIIADVCFLWILSNGSLFTNFFPPLPTRISNQKIWAICF